MEEIVSKYKNIPLHYKMLFLLALLGASGYMSYTDNIEPAFAELAAAKTEQEQITNQIQAMSVKRKSADDIQVELREAEEELITLMESLPPDPELERTLGNVAAIAKETNVQLIDFVPVKSTANEAPIATPPIGDSNANKNNTLIRINELVHEVRFSTTLVGSFAQTMTFLDQALSLPRVMKIERFELVPVNGNKLGAEPLITTKVDFLTYSQKLKIAVTRLDKKQATPKKAAAHSQTPNVILSSTDEKSEKIQ